MRRMQQLALRRKQQAEMERIAKQQAQLKALADEKASLDANTNDNKSDMKSIEAVEAAPS
jgi:alkylation response protein AidB-like acyl-CoA dehydrogenase